MKEGLLLAVKEIVIRRDGVTLVGTTDVSKAVIQRDIDEFNAQGDLRARILVSQPSLHVLDKPTRRDSLYVEVTQPPQRILAVNRYTDVRLLMHNLNN